MLLLSCARVGTATQKCQTTLVVRHTPSKPKVWNPNSTAFVRLQAYLELQLSVTPVC